LLGRQVSATALRVCGQTHRAFFEFNPFRRGSGSYLANTGDG
jgi:hypothetical protein